MSIDITAKALSSLQAEGSVSKIPAEAYTLGYKRGWDDALALAIQVEQAINNDDNGSFCQSMLMPASCPRTIHCHRC